MPLTHAAVLSAATRPKTYKIHDRLGLFLEVTAQGGKRWRAKFRFANRENRLSLGIFPMVGLRAARLLNAELRAQIARGVDPSGLRKEAKRLARIDNSFEAIAREWFKTFSSGWAASHADKVIRRLENYVFPWIGKVPVRDVKARDLLECIRRLEHQNTNETARRVLQSCGQILRYAVVTERAEIDVSHHLRGALAPINTKHLASVRSPKEVGALMRAIEGYDGRMVTRFALRLAPLVFVRPGELRQAGWHEFDFEQREWRIPAERMKARFPHIVPLSTQALALLREFKALTGTNRFLFIGDRDPERPMSNNVLNAALRRLGYSKHDMTPHGFRSMASTLLNELGWSGDAIERQLAHGERDAVRGAYNYAQYLPERRAMMQAWADYLEHLRKTDYLHSDEIALRTDCAIGRSIAGAEGPFGKRYNLHAANTESRGPSPA
jgi:integrase